MSSNFFDDLQFVNLKDNNVHSTHTNTILDPTITTVITGHTTVPYYNNRNNQESTTDIEGKMVCVKFTMSTYEFETVSQHFHPDDIKIKLCDMLAKELYHNANIEFTKETDLNTNNTIFRARIFVVPDTVVRLLRLNGYDTK